MQGKVLISLWTLAKGYVCIHWHVASSVHTYDCTLAAATDQLFGFMQGKPKSSSEMMLFTLWLLQIAEGSTVIDMTGPEPSLVRAGKGDPSLFVQQTALA